MSGCKDCCSGKFLRGYSLFSFSEIEADNNSFAFGCPLINDRVSLHSD